MGVVPSPQTGVTALLVLTLAALGRCQTTTKKLFLPNGNEATVAWSGSVIGACSESTTYALRCTATPKIVPTNAVERSAEATYTRAVSQLCGDANGPPLIVTEGPSGFYQAAQASASGVAAMESISCALSGTTEATCSMTVKAKHASGVEFGNGASAVMTGTQVPLIDVTLTAGVQKLAKATGKVCAGGAGANSVSIALMGMAFVVGICAVFAL